MKRKEFIYKTGATALLLSMGVSLSSCSDDSEDILPATSDDTNTPNNNDDDSSSDNAITFDLNNSPFNALRNTDAWVLHPDNNILIVNVDDIIKAFSSVCTHSGCSRDWEFNGSNARCTCHGSIFSNEGAVVSGPATRSLTELAVSVDEDIVTINL